LKKVPELGLGPATLQKSKPTSDMSNAVIIIIITLLRAGDP
jgi:hypothetical protein